MKPLGPVRGEGRRDKGSVAIITAIVIVVLVGFAAFVVDVGHLYRVRNELQNVADSAALAGARMLNGAADGIEKARTEANDFAKRHTADNTTMLGEVAGSGDLDLQFGRWYFEDAEGNLCSPAPCFHHFTDPASVPTSINAVRVAGFRTSASGHVNSPVRHFFAQLLGYTQSNVDADAIAVGGGPAQPCGFPLVVPYCQLLNPNLNPEDPSCEWCMRFQMPSDDNAGWTTFSEHGGCGASQITDLVDAACGLNGSDVDPTTNSCSNCSAAVQVDSTIKTCNGNNMNNNDFCGRIYGILMRSGTPHYFDVNIPILDSGTLDFASCGSFAFSGDYRILGFARLTIYGVRCGNGAHRLEVTAPLPDGATPCTPSPSGDVIYAKLACGQDSTNELPGAPIPTGWDTTRVRLVQ